MSIANTSQSKKLMKLIPAVLFAVASNWPNNAQAATAPSCVNLQQSKQVIRLAPDKKIARATNNCSGTQRFRMIWAWAADGSCKSVVPGGWVEESRGIGFPPEPYVNELRKC